MIEVIVAERSSDEPTLKEELEIPTSFLSICASTARSHFNSGHYWYAESLARGLVAADQHHVGYRTLLVGCLSKMGHIGEAIALVDEGLKYRPEFPDYVELREALVRMTFAQA